MAHEAGKGSRQRKSQITEHEKQARWDLAFGKKDTVVTYTDAERYQFIRKVMVDDGLFDELRLQDEYGHHMTESQFDMAVDKIMRG